MSRRGRRGSFKKRFLIIKKRRAFISFYFNIYINRSFFHPRYFNKSFFLPLRSIFPVNISLFVCFYVVVVVVAVSFFCWWFLLSEFSPPYHTSHSESLDVTDRMDVPVSTRSVILETLVVGLAAVDGDSAELWGVRPASERDLMPLGPIAWCWSLEKKKGGASRGRGREKNRGWGWKKMREMAIRPENVPPPHTHTHIHTTFLFPFPSSSSCKIGLQTRLSFPLPAPAMHACFYQIASFQGEGGGHTHKTQHYLEYQMLEEM